MISTKTTSTAAAVVANFNLERVHSPTLGVRSLGTQQLLHVLLDHVGRAHQGIPSSQQRVVQRDEPLDVEGDEMVGRVRGGGSLGRLLLRAGGRGSLGGVAVLNRN